MKSCVGGAGGGERVTMEVDEIPDGERVAAKVEKVRGERHGDRYREKPIYATLKRQKENNYIRNSSE